MLTALLLTLFCVPAHAHIGNKDVYQTITAGPYKLFITIRTPIVIPGVATIEVRSVGAPITSLTITPLLLTGEASKHPPTPDAMKPSPDDPAFYTGSLWLMSQGSWQVRFGIDGAAGPVETSVPVPAIPIAMLHMDRPMGLLLGALGVVLLIGIVSIVVAAMGESQLPPGMEPDARHRRRATVSGVLALAGGPRLGSTRRVVVERRSRWLCHQHARERRVHDHAQRRHTGPAPRGTRSPADRPLHPPP